MTFDYVSDIHIDFIFRNLENITEKRIRISFDSVFKTKKSDYLLVAGDSAQNPKLAIKFFDMVAKMYDYKHIFDVGGNHLLYITSRSELKRYGSSLNKLKYYKENAGDKLTVLDGDVVEIEGVKIGGAMGWYDTAYNDIIYQHSVNEPDIFTHWHRTLNDSRYITDLKHDYLQLTNSELDKVKKVLTQRPDVMITHVSPLCTGENFVEYPGNRTNTFYCFDGQDLVEQYSPTVWIFGHQHKSCDYMYKDTALFVNAHGYPDERKNPQLKTFIIRRN